MNALQRPWVAIILSTLMIMLLILFPFSSSVHYLITHLIFVEIIIGLVYYRKWVIWVTIFIIAIHLSLDALILKAFPVSAFTDSLIQFLLLVFSYKVFDYHATMSKRFSDTIQATQVGMWEWNVITNDIYVNKHWAKMLGYTVDELKPLTIETWEKLTHPEDLKKAYNQLNNLINQEQQIYDIDIRMYHKNGSIVWIADRGQVTEYTKDMKPKILRGWHLDITDKKQVEEEIIYQRDLMDYIIEHMNSAVAIHDKDLNYLYVSNSYKTQFKIDEDIIGKNHYDVFPDLPDRWKKVHQQSLQGEVISSDRDKYVHDDGHVDWTRWESRPWYDKEGNIGGIIIYTEVINTYIEKEQELKETHDTLQTVMDDLPIGIAINSVYPKTEAIYMNDNFPKIYGTTKKALMKSNSFWNVVYEDETYREKIKQRVISDIKTNDPEKMQWHDIPLTENGEIKHYVTAYTTPLPNKDLFISTVIDTTKRKKLELSLEKKAKELFIQKEEIEATLLAIGDAVISTDSNGKINAINEIASEITGYTQKEAIGQIFSSLITFQHETTKKELRCPIKRVLDTEETIHLENHTELVSKAGKEYLIEDSAAPIHDKNGKLIGVILVFRDVTEKKHKQREINYLSLHDYLTGLYNRRFFAEELARRDKKEHYPLGIMMMDLNGLKILNDAYGHEIGDKALKLVAKTIEETIGSRGIPARIGGDEFTAIISNTSEKELLKIKQQLQKNISNRHIKDVELSLAVGFTIKQDKNTSFTEILKDAENQMYKYKISEGISARNKTIQAILNTLTKKYELERKHSENVSYYARLIGEALDLTKDDLQELEFSGMFHDIGKITIPDSILNKTDKLTKEEYNTIKEHTTNGYQILRAADEYSDLAEHALLHHEWYDGTGYPEGIKGEDIPLFARIISVVDAFEAMTSTRPYREALPTEYAIKELKDYSGRQFDPSIVSVFVEKVLPIIEENK
ncbi:MAG: PAS domain S-box protein [Candidatus Izimaplasma sp.]|nr:PAS domain S-box protein [Candidatus Izimaplasma bacterium]